MRNFGAEFCLQILGFIHTVTECHYSFSQGSLDPTLLVH